MTIQRKRVDANQGEIVKYLRKRGALVRSTAMVGDGFPDMVVAFCGCLALVEVKDGSQPPSKRKLLDSEQAFFDEWGEYAYIVEDIVSAELMLLRMKEKREL